MSSLLSSKPNIEDRVAPNKQSNSTLFPLCFINGISIRNNAMNLCKCGCGHSANYGEWKRGHWLKGFKHTDESKKKMSESLKGKVSPNKGKKFSDEHREKLSESHKGQTAWNKGKKLSEEHIDKLSKAHRGLRQSEETKKRRSEWMKINSPHIGHSPSDETKKKMSLVKLGREKSPETIAKIIISKIVKSEHDYCDAFYDKEYKQDCRKSGCEMCGLPRMMSLKLWGCELTLHHHEGNFDCHYDKLLTLCRSCHPKMHKIIRQEG